MTLTERIKPKNPKPQPAKKPAWLQRMTAKDLSTLVLR